MTKCGDRINLDSLNNLEETVAVLNNSITSLTQFIINMKEFPPQNYVEFKWRSTLNVNHHKNLVNKALNQHGMVTELMLQMYTLAIVENKRGCSTLCQVVHLTDRISMITALKNSFKCFKQASEIFRYMSEHCFKLPHFEFPVRECPELTAETVSCFATMNQAMALMCAISTAILEEKPPSFVAKLAKNCSDKFDVLISQEGQMFAFSSKTGINYKDMPTPNMFSWARLCTPIYKSIYCLYYGKHYYAEEGERNKRLGITMVREAEKYAAMYPVEVQNEKGQKWKEATLIQLTRLHTIVTDSIKQIDDSNTVYFASALPLSEVPDLETPEVLARNAYEPVGFEQLMSVF